MLSEPLKGIDRVQFGDVIQSVISEIFYYGKTMHF